MKEGDMSRTDTDDTCFLYDDHTKQPISSIKFKVNAKSKMLMFNTMFELSAQLKLSVGFMAAV